MPINREIVLPAALDFRLKEGITGMPTITTKDGVILPIFIDRGTPIFTKVYAPLAGVAMHPFGAGVPPGYRRCAGRRLSADLAG